MAGKNSKSTLEGMSGGIFLVGLGVLFLVDSISFWPWILVVIGLAILFTNPGMFFPGVLILIGLSIIVGALVQPPALKKSKRKPKIIVGYGDHDDDLFDDDDDDEYYYDDDERIESRRHATR